MAAVKSHIPVKVNGHHPAFSSLKTKFESLSDGADSKKRTASGPGPQYTSFTLGRKPSRSGSFSFQRSKDVPDISVVPPRQIFLRDQENRISSRSLGDSIDYDTATISTPPRPVRRQKKLLTTPSLIPVPQRTLDGRKIKEKLSRKPSPIFTSTSSFLSPAQSLTNLSLYPSSPVRKAPPKRQFAAPVYNLPIAPSTHNVRNW